MSGNFPCLRIAVVLKEPLWHARRKEVRKPVLKSDTTMSEIKNTASLNDIREIVQQIVERFRPQKVILFGSYAQGNPTQDSDVDLLIIMETNDQALHAAARISAGIDHPFPLDILVFRPSELKASLERKGVFATEVVAKGIVLHEARNYRMDRQGGR